MIADLSAYRLVRERLGRLPYALAREGKTIALDETELEITVAIADVLSIAVLDEIRLLTRKRVVSVAATRDSIDLALELCYQHKEGEMERTLSSIGKEGKREEWSGVDLLDARDESPVVRFVNLTLLEAIQQGASDIHLEPGEQGVSLRYRIDGVLQKREPPPLEAQIAVATRLKVMAQLDIAEQRLPQDGRIVLRIGGREVDLRVSTIPTIHGERIVLRILDKGNILLGLDRIGMTESLLHKVRRLTSAPEGIVLVTGPTGSGKTTTLYSALSELNAAEMNILTIEDPVEYKLPGISQIPVNPRIELNFARGLRHMLRQDPDVILIGEIRDRETAEIAIQASLTGHLVFSTLHTNDAPSAITRLVDMGIEPYLLASSLIGVLAQRLVRKNCPHCTAPYTPLASECAEVGLPQQPLYKGVGCSHCLMTGYKGRHALYELMGMSARIKEQTVRRVNTQEIRRIAREEGMETLFESGRRLVANGTTTGSELLRMTRLAEGE